MVLPCLEMSLFGPAGGPRSLSRVAKPGRPAPARPREDAAAAPGSRQGACNASRSPASVAASCTSTAGAVCVAFRRCFRDVHSGTTYIYNCVMSMCVSSFSASLLGEHSAPQCGSELMATKVHGANLPAGAKVARSSPLVVWLLPTRDQAALAIYPIVVSSSLPPGEPPRAPRQKRTRPCGALPAR